MKRIILIFVLPIVIFIGAAYSTYWFIKSGEIKKNITKLIESSPNSSIGNITASGFPFSHNIVIKEVSFEVIDFADNKSDIAIEQINAHSSVFADEFSVNIVGNVSITNSQNQIHLLTFNSPPTIKLFTDNFKVQKISYIDNGYKILDESRNPIFSVGNSVVTLTMNGDEVKNTVLQVNFSNISGFDMFALDNKAVNIADAQNVKLLETTQTTTTTTPDTTTVTTTTTTTPVPAPAPTTTTTTTTPAPAPVPPVTAPALPELPTDPATQSAQPAVVLNQDMQNTHRNFNADLTIQSVKSKVTDITINSFEINSPLYKINAKGSINSLGNKVPDINLNLKVQNLDNILLYLRQFIATVIPLDTPIVSAEAITVTESAAATEVTATVSNGKTPTPTPAANGKTPAVKTVETPVQVVVEAPQIAVKPSLGDQIVTLITDLSKRNPKTNPTAAEFDIVYKESKISINNATHEEIMVMIQPIIDTLTNTILPLLTNQPNVVDDKINLENSLKNQAGENIAPIEKVNEIEVNKEANKPVENSAVKTSQPAQPAVKVNGTNGATTQTAPAVPTAPTTTQPAQPTAPAKPAATTPQTTSPTTPASPTTSTAPAAPANPTTPAKSSAPSPTTPSDFGGSKINNGTAAPTEKTQPPL